MRNLAILTSFILGLFFASCNPSSDSRSDENAFGGGATPYSLPSASNTSLTASDSGGYGLLTWPGDVDVDEAARLYTKFTKNGVTQEGNICAGDDTSLLTCDTFEGVSKATAAMCTGSKCSKETPLDPPKCDSSGKFYGEVDEIVGVIQGLMIERFELAENFIAFVKEIYDALKNKESEAAKVLLEVSQMDPCDLLGKSDEFFDALRALDYDGNLSAEELAAILTSVLGGGTVGIAAIVVSIKEMRKNRSPKEFLKVLKQNALDTAKTAAAKKKALDAALLAEQTEWAKFAGVKAKLDDAKYGFEFPDGLEDLLTADDFKAMGEFKFDGDTWKVDQMEVDDLKAMAAVATVRSQDDFDKLPQEVKDYLLDPADVKDFDQLSQKGGFQEAGKAYLEKYKVQLGKKLDQALKAKPKDAELIAKLKEVGAVSSEDMKKLVSARMEAWDAVRSAQGKAQKAGAEAYKAKVAAELNDAIKDLDEFDKLTDALEKVAAGDGTVKDLKDALANVLPDDSKLLAAVSHWDAKSTDLADIAEAMKKLGSVRSAAAQRAVANVKAVTSKIGDVVGQGLKYASDVAGVVGKVNSSSRVTFKLADDDDDEDADTWKKYVEGVPDFLDELAENKAALTTAGTDLVGVESRIQQERATEEAKQ